MKKKQKTITLKIPKMPKFPKIGKGLVIGTLAIALLVGVGTVKASDGSFWDNVSVVTGNRLAEILADKVDDIASIFGAVSGPDMYNDYFRYGSGDGIRTFKHARGLSTATTTPCAIQSPAATSTLLSAGIKFDTSSTTATTFSLGIGASSQSTTTQIGTDYAIGANAQAFINASTSPAAGAVEVIAPSQWLVFDLAGGTGTYSPTGSCHATFEEYLSL